MPSSPPLAPTLLKASRLRQFAQRDRRRPFAPMNFASYQVGNFFDEFLTDAKEARPGASNLMHSIQSLPPGEFARRQAAAERALMQMGITFNVYGEQAGVEKIFPFDIVPRIVSAAEWWRLEKGLKQRIHALNLFIDDLYHEQKILKDGVVPREIISLGQILSQAMHRLETAARHLVPYHRHRPGAAQRRADLRAGRQFPLSFRRFLRACRTGEVMKSLFPEGICRVQGAPGPGLSAQAARHAGVSGPGPHRPARASCCSRRAVYNSAYFEHSFLAQQMGVELVEGRDLGRRRWPGLMRTTKGFERVDVIYRRIDDDFLDPEVLPRGFDARACRA